MTREPTPYDQLMLELINRARENPNLEAQFIALSHESLKP